MNKTKIYKYIFIILPFLMAFPFHFLFQLIPFPPFAIYFPINESVFEHTKLTFTPLILTYLIFYIFNYKKIDKTKFLSTLIISIATATITMLSFYYLFNLIANKDITILNILSLFIAIISSQILAIFTYKKNVKWSKEISIYALLTITFMFLIFTTTPPQINFFKDLS